MSLRDLVANNGLTDEMCGAIFQAEMRSYRDELVHLEAAWKMRPDWAAITDRDSDLAIYEGVWSGISTDGLGAPRNAEFVGKHFAERSEEDQDRICWLLRDQHALSDALRSDAQKRLEEFGVTANAVSLPVVVDTLARARAEAARRVRVGELMSVSSSARHDAPAPPTVSHPIAGTPPVVAMAPMPVAPAEVVRPSVNLTTEQEVFAAMSPTQFVEVFIREKFKALDHRTGTERETKKVGESVERDMRWAASLLEKSLPKSTPLAEVNADQLRDLDAWLDRFPVSIGKSPRDRAPETSLQQIVDLATERVTKGEMSAGDIGLSPNTTNKHWHNLSRLPARLCKRLPDLRPIDVSEYFSLDKKDARDARDCLTFEQGEALFRLPPWTGSTGLKDRLTAGTTIIHDALYRVLLLVWYTGARREEICRLTLKDLILEPIPRIFIRPTETGDVKTENAVRRIPLHSEFIRLGFLPFVEAMGAEGETLLFPEMYPSGGTKRAIGDVF